jgi:plasmid stabilization system protein ParE
MAELIWTEPALSDLDAIADYIELDNPEAARRLIQNVFQHVEQLAEYPESGSRPRELRGSRYRQIIEPPCRIFYRYDAKRKKAPESRITVCASTKTGYQLIDEVSMRRAVRVASAASDDHRACE